MNQMDPNEKTNINISSDPVPTAERGNLSQETQKIEKEYERKLLMVKHKEKVTRYIKIVGWSVLGLLLVIAFIIIALKVVDIFKVEEKIDTGMVIKEDLPPEDFTIETKKITLLQPIKGETNYDILVQLKNNNAEWGVSRLKYKILLLDKFDKVVGEKERISFILPGEEKNLIEVGVKTDRVADKAKLEVDLQEIQKLKQNIDLNIQIEKSSYSVNNNKSIVEGSLFNNSPFTFDRVNVAVVLYDKAGNVVGLNYTNFGPFVTKTRRSFIAQWPETIFADVEKIYIEPSVNVFQTSSFINIYGTGQVLEY